MRNLRPVEYLDYAQALKALIAINRHTTVSKSVWKIRPIRLRTDVCNNQSYKIYYQDVRSSSHITTSKFIV